MRLLVITQAVDLNDANLGFFHEWIGGFAKHASAVDVVALRVGEYALPRNVSVHKIFGNNKLVRFIGILRLLGRFMPQADKVFIHMAPIYAILASPFARWHKKPMLLWYVHKTVDWKLRLAEKLVQGVASASPESFRLPSKKVSFLGHGIDTDLFAPPQNAPAGFAMLTAGRLSRSKRIDVLMRAAALASGRLPTSWKFIIVGGAITRDDTAYEEELKELARKLGIAERVFFAGSAKHSEMPAYYKSAHIFLHASVTGSIDKAVLEAMSTALPVISSSEAFWYILPEEYVVKVASAEAFASAIIRLQTRSRDTRLRNTVQDRFKLSDFIQKLTTRLAALSIPQ